MISFLGTCLLTGALFSCAGCQKDSSPNSAAGEQYPTASRFAYPVGGKETVTEARDKSDRWYNAQDFGENNHLGEDWNANSGGDSDCGLPVFSSGAGLITYAADAGSGWGNVVIVDHRLPGGKKVQSLYGHLDKIVKRSGTVRLREQIGTIGSANGRYRCHLHFEIRDDSCLMWNGVFVGYSPVRAGWLDPSDFIDKHR